MRWSSSASMASQKAGDSSPSNRHTYRWCTLQCEHLLLILPPSSSRMSTPWKLGKVRQSARCFECRPPHPRHNLLPQRPHRRCGGRGGGCSSEPGDCSGIASADEASAEPAFRVVELWVELWELSPCLMVGTVSVQIDMLAYYGYCGCCVGCVFLKSSTVLAAVAAHLGQQHGVLFPEVSALVFSRGRLRNRLPMHAEH